MENTNSKDHRAVTPVLQLAMNPHPLHTASRLPTERSVFPRTVAEGNAPPQYVAMATRPLGGTSAE